MLFGYNKKGVSEIVSYLLLTLLIVIISSATYFFAQNYLENTQQEEDSEMMPVHLKKISFLIDEISSFDGERGTYFISFATGQLETRGSTLQYASVVEFEGDEICLTKLCYSSRGGYEVISINLSNNYIFSQNITLTPGSYFLQFEHDKEGDEINVVLK